MEQDSNAQSLGSGVMAARTASKASIQYKNEAWDLVDAEEEGAINLEEIEEDELPDEMKGMSSEEKKAYVEEKANERNTIQEKINVLTAQRQKYVALERGKLQDITLDTVIIKAIREQAIKKNYKFE